MEQSSDLSVLSKIFRWLIFIPLLYLFFFLARIILLYVQFWVKDQSSGEGWWAYFVVSTAFGSIWIPYLIEYFVVTWIIHLCPKPKIGAAIALTLMVLSIINYYFVADNSFYLGVGLVDIVMLGTLVYICFSDNDR